MNPLEPYLVWIEVGIVAILAVALFGGGWKAGAGLTESRWQRAAAKAEAQHTASLASARVAERASYVKNQEVSRGYQSKLAQITADRDRLRDMPARVVRVYIPAAGPGLPAAGAIAGGSGAGSAGSAQLAGEARSGSGISRDIGADLYRIVDDSDARELALGEQVRRLQAACGAQPAQAAGK